MLNQAVMTGRLVGAPELRHTQSEIAVTSFRIAVRRDFAKNGENETDFFDVVAWRSTAEFVCKWFSKGSMVTVVGPMQNRRWKDKEGQDRFSTELVAERAYFGDSKGKTADSDSLPSDFDPFEDGELPY